MANPRVIKDFRRLKFCPRCKESKANPCKSTLHQNVHQFKNWDAYRASCKAAENPEFHSGPARKPIELKIKSLLCVCPVCGYSAYYLKDTGEECDRMARKIGKRRWKKLTREEIRRMAEE